VIEQAAIVPEPGADARWQAWQRRGSEADRRRATMAQWVMIAVALALTAWLLVELVSR
jgi:hypothetical protein